MKSKLFSSFSPLVVALPFLLLAGCGGGSSGTSLGVPPAGRGIQFSGIIISKDGNELPFAKVTLLNTDDSVEADEAGAFELSSDFPGGDAALEISPSSGESAVLPLGNLSPEKKDVELSISYNDDINSAQRLSLTLRAKIVRSCGALFLNTRTIKQTGPLPDGTKCTIETEIKSDGLSANNLVYQLQHRGCASDDPWEFSAAGVTGSSGPGNGEIDFEFHNDQKHCVYRIVGPIGVDGVSPISAHLHSLRKIKFDGN